MEFSYATIMTWMKYIQAGMWILEIGNTQINTEEEVIQKYNDLFKNELAREGTSNYAFNPLKGIGYMEVRLSKNKGQMIVIDKYRYLSAFFEGIYGKFGDRKLALNINVHGFNGDYFKYVDKEDDNYVFIEHIVNGIHGELSPNVKRMINILYMRQQPYCEKFSKKEIMFCDYGEEEREAMIQECHKY